MTGPRKPSDQHGEPGRSADRRSSVCGVAVGEMTGLRRLDSEAPDMAVDCGLRPDMAPQGWFDVVLVRPIFHGRAVLSTPFSPLSFKRGLEGPSHTAHIVHYDPGPISEP